MKLIFDEADPKPPTIRLKFGFDNLGRSSGQATLSNAEERANRFGRRRPATSLPHLQAARQRPVHRAGKGRRRNLPWRAGRNNLTLATYYPFYFVGSAPDRFIVRAERVT